MYSKTLVLNLIIFQQFHIYFTKSSILFVNVVKQLYYTQHNIFGFKSLYKNTILFLL